MSTETITRVEPPPIDQRGDIRPNPYSPVTDENSAQYEAWLVNGDPLPLPPGTTDADLPDEPRGPVSPTTLAASWRAGQRHVDAIREGDAWKRRDMAADQLREIERLSANLAAGANDDTDALRAELSQYRHHDPPQSFVANMQNAPSSGYLYTCPTAPLPATHSRPTGETRHVERLAHTEDCVRPPQGVPDGFPGSREAHLLAQALRDLPPHVASDQQAERAADEFFADVRRWAWYVLAFAAGGALVGTVDWLRAVGRI